MGRWNTQRRFPSSSERPKMRPSAVRTTTTLREIEAGEITSPCTAVAHTCLPVATS